jgi:glycine cleavage system H protein
MDGFTYTNIFETKGIEYLVVIAFLALLIPFWIVLNKQAKISRQIQHALGILSANVLRIPQGLFYSANHTWTHLESSGLAKIGIDDLLLHITGEVRFSHLKKPGQQIQKGEALAEIGYGGKILRLFSPISGEIMGTNSLLTHNPEMLNEDPYKKGWMYKVKPSNWTAETNTYYLAEEATKWSVKELERFKDFLATSVGKYTPESSEVIMQDGGEIFDHPLSALPDEVWQDFQKSFLS